MFWADLDEFARRMYADEQALNGVYPSASINFASNEEPIWINEAGDMVRADGGPLARVTLRDPNYYYPWLVAAALAFVVFVVFSKSR